MPLGKSSCHSFSPTLGSSSVLFLSLSCSTELSSSSRSSKIGATKLLEHHTWCANHFLPKKPTPFKRNPENA